MSAAQPSEQARRAEAMTAPEAAALVSSSALFSFVLFKLLSFFVTPSNLVLCFLIAAHPVGVLLADRWSRGRERRAVALYLLALGWSIVSLFFLRHLHPALPQPGMVPGLALSQVIGFTVLAAASQGPFFLFTGVVELLALRAAERATGRTSRAYAIVLGGTALGIAIGYGAIRWTGAIGLTAVAVGVAAALALPRGRARRSAIVITALATGVSVVRPALDAAFVGLVQPIGPTTAAGQLRRGGKLLFSRWDRHAYTQVIAQGGVVVGAYDNFKYWEAARAQREEGAKMPPDTLVFHAIPPNGRAAIVGVGGGRQVQEAKWASPSLAIDAFEINGSIVEFFRNIDPSANGGAYVAPGVRVFDRDGRRGIAESPVDYDCIYLPDAGTAFAYYRNLVADPLFLYTRESYRGYLSRLRPEGVLVTAFALPSNPDGILTRRVSGILAELDLEVRSYTSPQWDILVAARRGEATTALARLDQLSKEAELTPIAPRAGNAATGDDSGFYVPYFIYAVYDRLPAYFIRTLVAGFAIAGIVVLLLASRARRAPGVGSPVPRLVIATALGANFVILENALVLAVARVLWSTTDAVILGSAYFLVCAVVGAFAAPLGSRRPSVLLGLFAAAIGAAAWTVAHATSLPAMLGGWLPVCVLSGALFPAVLERSGPRQTRYVYAADGVGALLGIVVVFFVPLLTSISTLGFTSLALCAGAACAVLAWSAVTPPAPGALTAAAGAGSEGGIAGDAEGFELPAPEPLDRRVRMAAGAVLVLGVVAVVVTIRRTPPPAVGPIPASERLGTRQGTGSSARAPTPHVLSPLDATGQALLGDLTVGTPFEGAWRVEAVGATPDGGYEVELARPGAGMRLKILARGKGKFTPPARTDRYDIFYGMTTEGGQQPTDTERVQLAGQLAAWIRGR